MKRKQYWLVTWAQETYSGKFQPWTTVIDDHPADHLAASNADEAATPTPLILVFALPITAAQAKKLNQA